MKRKILCCLTTLLAMSALSVVVYAQQPAKPEQLKAEVVGHRVELSWKNPDVGAVLAATGFESADAEPGDRVSLEVDGWTVKTTNNSDYSCTWFNYPTSEFTGADNYDWLIHSGERSAVVYLDVVEDGEHDMHQDEWLISPVLDKAAYLQFSSFIDPRVVINGADPTYPDHFVVVASTDGGETWGEPLWDARYDASPEGGWQTVTLALTQVP
ncbi:MAG: choice-of-anchor J domain-containing protein, partial [Bacteroidales bacterium]|nr:choice-of-anchor J domain-containing protein [Bacteroidales bacterium]